MKIHINLFLKKWCEKEFICSSNFQILSYKRQNSCLLVLMLIMKGYGYLFGFIRLIKDTHHDEVFIEKNNVIIMRNNHWLYDYEGLVAIATELGYGKVSIIDYGDFDDDMECE